jgi:integrase
MARTRYPEDTLGIEGKGSGAHYYTRFRIYDFDGNKKRNQVTLGLASKFKRKANKRKAKLIAERTSHLPEILAVLKGEMTFKSFYDDRFLPLKTHWGQPHRESFTYIMKTYVLPKVGGLSLNAIDKVTVQVILNAYAKRLSKNTISHIRRTMVEVFEEAVEQEFITRNPATKTHIPEEAAEADETILTKQNLFDLIDNILDPRDRAIFAVGSFCALRTSELFGMSWRAFHYDPETGRATSPSPTQRTVVRYARRQPRQKQAGPMSLFRRYLSRCCWNGRRSARTHHLTASCSRQLIITAALERGSSRRMELLSPTCKPTSVMLPQLPQRSITASRYRKA